METIVSDQALGGLTSRIAGLLSDSVLMIAALIGVGVVISLLWTEFEKAKIQDRDGKDLSDRAMKWRVRSLAFWSGTISTFILLVVFLPVMTPSDWPLWSELIVRAAVAAALAPMAGLGSPVAWVIISKWIIPRIDLWTKGSLKDSAEKAFGRRGHIKDGEDGSVGFKPDPTPEDPDPKTEVIERGPKGPSS